MTFSKIECFLMAAKTLNFSEAAKKLYITQPVLSRQIASMEEELGLSLFVRSKKVQLTKAGQSLASNLEKVWNDYQDAIQQAKNAEESRITVIRIGIYDGQSIVNDPRVPILEKYKEAAPNTKFVYSKNSISKLSEMLMNGSLDIVLGCIFDFVDREEFDIYNVCRTRSFVVISCNHALAGRNDLTLKDLQNETIIVPDESESPHCQRDLSACFRRAGLRPPAFAIVPDIGSRALWLMSGEGIIIETKQLDLWGNESFVFIDLPEISSIPISVISKKGNKRVEDLLRFLEETVPMMDFPYPDSNISRRE